MTTHPITSPTPQAPCAGCLRLTRDLDRARGELAIVRWVLIRLCERLDQHRLAGLLAEPIVFEDEDTEEPA